MNINFTKLGNSLRLRTPKALAEEFNLHDGSELDIRILKRAKTGRQIIIEQCKHGLDNLLDEIESQERPEFNEADTVGLEAY